MKQAWEIVETLDGVDEGAKSEYEEWNGVFRRKVEIEDVGGLKSALQKERDARKKFEQDLSKFKDIDPERYEELLKQQEEGLSEKERYENALKKYQKEIEDLKGNYEQKLSETNSQLQLYHADRLAREAAIKSGVQPEDVDDVLILSRKYRTMDEKGNIVILDDDGDPTGKTLEDFFNKDFKEKKPRYYKGIPGGSGSQSGSGSSGNEKTVSRAEWDKMDAFSRSKFIKDGGKVVD
jgi:tetratricopeptide (TPR) repeat protein